MTEKLIGGKGDGKADGDFSKKQVEMGNKVEMEHTKDPQVAKEITRDHLSEMGDYYSRLKEMEAKAELHKSRFSPKQESCIRQVKAANPGWEKSGKINPFAICLAAIKKSYDLAKAIKPATIDYSKHQKPIDATDGAVKPTHLPSVQHMQSHAKPPVKADPFGKVIQSIKANTLKKANGTPGVGPSQATLPPEVLQMSHGWSEDDLRKTHREAVGETLKKGDVIDFKSRIKGAVGKKQEPVEDASEKHRASNNARVIAALKNKTLGRNSMGRVRTDSPDVQDTLAAQEADRKNRMSRGTDKFEMLPHADSAEGHTLRVGGVHNTPVAKVKFTYDDNEGSVGVHHHMMAHEYNQLNNSIDLEKYLQKKGILDQVERNNHQWVIIHLPKGQTK